MIEFDNNCPDAVVNSFIEDTDKVYASLTRRTTIYHGFPVSRVPRATLERHVAVLIQRHKDFKERILLDCYS